MNFLKDVARGRGQRAVFMGRRSAGREKVETGRDGGGEDRMSETEGGRRRSNYIGFAKCVIEKDCEMYFFLF